MALFGSKCCGNQTFLSKRNKIRKQQQAMARGYVKLITDQGLYFLLVSFNKLIALLLMIFIM